MILERKVYGSHAYYMFIYIVILPFYDYEYRHIHYDDGPKGCANRIVGSRLHMWACREVQMRPSL